MIDLNLGKQKEKFLADFKSQRKGYILWGLFLVFSFLFVLYIGPLEGLERFGLVGTKKQQEQPTRAEISAKLMVIIFNPIIESQGNKRLNEVFGWTHPDVTTSGVLGDLNQNSHGNAAYSIVLRIEVDGFPVFNDGYTYTDDSYLSAHNTNNFYDSGCSGLNDAHCANLYKIINDYQVAQKVQSGEIDEVFLWGAPGFGFYRESAMAGDGAYYINAGLIPNVLSSRAFVIMMLNYERGVAEALESYGHRVEWILWKMYENKFPQPPSEKHALSRYIIEDRDLPGKGGIGDVHNPVNAQSDYDRANTRYVPSNAAEWFNFPNINYENRQDINCTAWGCDPRGYLKWWYDHMPYKAGTKDGCLNNWWEYILKVDAYKSSGACFTASASPSPTPTTIPTATPSSDVTLPTVSIDSPTNGGVVPRRSTVTIRASASDNVGVTKVEFLVNGSLICTDIDSSYSCNWQVPGKPNASYTLTAKAYDAAGNNAFVNITVKSSK